MTRPNRVRPTGEFAADAARGTLMGNRGILHDAQGQLGKARWRHKNWVCCTLTYGSIRRPIMAPGCYTELFFLDEATALAAGHRPCATCRRDAYERYRSALGAEGAPRIDALLHAARIDPATRRQRRTPSRLEDLPDGAMVLMDDEPHLVLGASLLPWRPAGYDAGRPRTEGSVAVLTPEPSVAALRAGYRASLHASAWDPEGDQASG